MVAARILMRLFLATSVSVSFLGLAACASAPPPLATPVAPVAPAVVAAPPPPAPKPEDSGLEAGGD